MRKKLISSFLFISIFLGGIYTYLYMHKINHYSIPEELLKTKNKIHNTDNLSDKEREILLNFKNIPKYKYKKKYIEIAESIRPILGSENGYTIGSIILEDILLNGELSNEEKLYILNKLRILKNNPYNLVENIQCTMEYIQLGQFVGDRYHIAKGKVALATIFSGLKGYEIANKILEEVLRENNGEINILALINLSENYLFLGEYDKVLENIEKINNYKKYYNEEYLIDIEVIKNSILCETYTKLKNKGKALEYLKKAEYYLNNVKGNYFIGKELVYETALEYYNLQFDFEQLNENKIYKTLKCAEEKNNLRFIYTSYDLLFEYYKKIENFEKYYNLKKKYDLKIKEINEMNYEILTLYTINSIESGIIARNNILLKKKLWGLFGMSLFLIIGIIFLLELFLKSKKNIRIDELTGIYNRKAFNEDIEKLKNKDYYMVIFDIDNFKKINDKYGHPFGDKVLKKVSRRISNKLGKKKETFFYRIGGEEFIIIFKKNSKEEVIYECECIRMAVELLKWKNKELKVTISGGLSKGQENIYEICDKLLYKSKKNGKNKILNNL
ncbi:diguanylate cyclase [Cetobacterium ceti]